MINKYHKNIYSIIFLSKLIFIFYFSAKSGDDFGGGARGPDRAEAQGMGRTLRFQNPLRRTHQLFSYLYLFIYLFKKHCNTKLT